MFHFIICLLVHYICLLCTGTLANTKKTPDKIFDAIKNVHEQLDDNNDGQINEVESANYMETELKSPNEEKKLHFHNNDAQISVDDLWKKWLDSPVYAWGVDDVVQWLKDSVELPKYEKTFRENNVIGKNMPQLATSKALYVQQELKITNKYDRNKIYLRASDLILFGNVDSKKEDKNFIAIKAIHSLLDDDLDGEINKNESVDFVQDELNGSRSMRHDSFHRNDDLISVDDLWRNWRKSAVYNWTNNDVITWLKDTVGLPQYEQVFRDKNVDGRSIPLLATNASNYLHKELGVLNSTHRKKIYLRASDIILFGVPEVHRNYFSDTIVLLTVIIASTLCLYSMRQQRLSKKQIDHLKNNMEYLKQAEQMLKELQEDEGLNDSKKRELQLREEIEEAKKEAERLHLEHSKFKEEKTKLQLVEQELAELRLALAKAENEIKYNEIRSPSALQNLLIVTYKKEVQHFQQKKQQALAQMQEAKEACEKVNKTKRAVFGSLRLAHGQSIDMVDQKILNAKSALAEVTKNLQERQYRWQQIEYICNFCIVNEEGNVNLLGKSQFTKPLLADNVLFGSKGCLDILDNQVAALSENEQLDNEVEAITQMGKFGRMSTESSSSQESIHSKSVFSDQPKQQSPLLIKKTLKSDGTNDEGNGICNSSGSVSPSFDANVISSSATCPNLEHLGHETAKHNALQRIYNRSNTEPKTLTRMSTEDISTQKLKSSSKKSKSRPLSLNDPKSIKKQKKLLSLSRLTNSP